ncbi:unnamed protein product [Adineta ricciae]|nr:unnamed protein product [Adineta ricciae]
MSFSPTFHQICSSVFVSDLWMNILQGQNNIGLNDWRRQASAEFQLLSDLCQLTNKTIKYSINRFLSQVVIVSSVMDEIDFNEQMNASVNQFYRSTLYNFDIQKDIMRLILQVDRFYLATVHWGQSMEAPDLVVNTVTNKTNNYSTQYVCYTFSTMG